MDTIPTDWNTIRIKSYKKDSLYSYACGVFPTLELLENRPSCVFRVYLSSQASSNRGAEKIRKRAEDLGVSVLVDDRTIERLSPKENCYAIGVFWKTLPSIRPGHHHIVLVNPADKGNLGTILRTITAFGLTDLAIISPAADLFDPKVVRSSMGAIFHVHLGRYDSFEAYLQEHGARRALYPFALQGGPLEEMKLVEERPYSLIFGNESSGLPEHIATLGQPVRIVHLNTVDSLNLPVAVAIGVHHVTEGRL